MIFRKSLTSGNLRCQGLDEAENQHQNIYLHQNVYLSTFARTMLMAEKVEHEMDYTYRFSPTRYAAKLFRAMSGAEKRNYEHLALQGIETVAEHASLRRIVKIGGFAVGLTETIFRTFHNIHDAERLWHKFIRPDRDPEEKRRRMLERERRHGYREARRRGQVYDPTLPARQHPAAAAGISLLREIGEQFNPFGYGSGVSSATRRIFCGASARFTHSHLKRRHFVKSFPGTLE